MNIVYYIAMLSISHGVTGAFIAATFPNPLLYIPLTLASHYLQDWIPHWDVGTGISIGKRKKSTAMFMELADLAITALLVYWFWHHAGSTTLMHAGIGAFVGLIPDFMEAPRNFLKWEPWFLKPFNNFHGMFHHSMPNVVVGLLPQIILVGVIWFLR
jgi:hypothetical protein